MDDVKGLCERLEARALALRSGLANGRKGLRIHDAALDAEAATALQSLAKELAEARAERDYAIERKQYWEEIAYARNDEAKTVARDRDEARGRALAAEAASASKDAELLALAEERDRLREALAFYADAERYRSQIVTEACGCCTYDQDAEIGPEGDTGEVARRALTEASHD